MQGYQPLSIGWRLAAMVAAVLTSALVIAAALLPFGLDSPQRGEAIVAREAVLKAMRGGAFDTRAVDAPRHLPEASDDLDGAVH